MSQDLSLYRAATPPTSGTTLPDADPLVVASWSGHKLLAPTNPTPGPEPATKPPPQTENPQARVHIGGHRLSRGAIRVRLAWPKRLETKRRRKNTANNQSMLVDHWLTLRPLSLPTNPQIRSSTPPLPGSLLSFGLRPYPNYKIRHDPPMRSEYPFEYSPPHSPMGTPNTASVGPPPLLGQTPTSTPKELSRESPYYDARPNTPLS